MSFQKNSGKILVCLVNMLVLFGIALNAQAVIYVNANATGTNNGTSWANAYKDLQSAIAAATYGEIWVAKGTYKPTTGTDRTISFLLKPNIKIYGHFAGNETDLNQRVLTNLENTTILSGDIGKIGDNSDNSYHVIYADGTGTFIISNYTVLDGFSITGGNANGTSPHDSGGGFYCNGFGASKECSPTLNNIIFSGNSASGNGGAMYNNGSGDEGGLSSPILTDVTFSNNSAASGGAMYNYSRFVGRSNPILTNVTFIGNSASGGGGAISNHTRENNSTGNLVLKNVIFSDNSAAFGGAIYDGGMYSHFNPTLTDVIFTNNSATQDGGALCYNGNSSPIFINVIFSGNSAVGSGGAIFSYAEDYVTVAPNLNNVIFSGNSATSGGAMYNYSNWSAYNKPILNNVTFSGNSANNGGALYNRDSGYGECAPILKNVILWGNMATNGSQIYNDVGPDGKTTLNISYSLIQGGIAGIFNYSNSYANAYSSVTDGGNNIDADPLFINPVPASSAPTTAGDYHLKSGSPAIDAGSNAAVSSIATDLDGNPRVSGSSADMGAYELPFYTVRFKASPSDGGTVSVSAQVIPSGGQTWPVTAIPAAGYKFLNWTGPGGFTTTSGNPMASANVTSNMTIIANFQPFTISNNKAIIVAGGGDYSTNAIWDDTETNADYAHGALLFQGYTPEKIYYLSAGSNLTNPVDGFASRQNLRDAIQSWAGDADNLLIYMVDHGGYETFSLNETEILRVSELDTWLDYIQQIIPGQVILIYDACESGSFIGRLNPPADKKRAVVVSSKYDEQAVFASEGTFSFSWNFWSQIYAGFSFYQAFLNAQNTMELSRSQHSLIDADGNGVPGEKADSAIAADIRIGDGIATGADFPLIGSVSVSPQTLSAGTSATISAENVIDSDGIKKVWAAITPPKNTVCYAADIPVTSLPITELRHTGNNRYEAIYSDFSMKGIYKIAVFATDNRNFTSIPDLQKHVVYVTQTQDFSPPVKKGDISGDNQVNLTDVISALQILSGLNPAQIRCDYAASGTDVNGDGRVGLQEVIYVLQTVAGLR